MRVIYAFAGLAAALWIAHDGPAWLDTLNYSRFPERTGARDALDVEQGVPRMGALKCLSDIQEQLF